MIRFDKSGSNHGAILYINKEKVDNSVREYLSANKIEVREYDEVFTDLN